jgi:hypothetical protein
VAESLASEVTDRARCDEAGGHVFLRTRRARVRRNEWCERSNSNVLEPDMETRTRCALIAAASLGLVALGGCRKKADEHSGHDHGAPSAAPPTNRVDIPAPVRTNLGITFARVETRNVARTLRVPGRFELLPTARREYRPAMPGRVDLLVSQHQKVEAGTALYRLDSARWREIQDQIASTQGSLEQVEARLASVGPIRESAAKRAEQLSERVAMLAERSKRLQDLQQSGSGVQRDTDEARGSLSQARAELAEVTEHGVELESRERELRAELGSLQARRDLLIDTAASLSGRPREELQTAWRSITAIEVRASAPGIVETFGVTNGGSVEQGGLVLSTVQPEQIRFRARGLQSDLMALKNGLACRIVPPGGAIPVQDAMDATLTLGLEADPEQRTIELFATPATLGSWARSGISGHLEIMTGGGASELAVPLSCIVRDGVKPILFRRDPANADKVIRMDADVGLNDGRWITLASGVKEGDEVVLDGVYQLMLATAGNAPKGGHFHSDGTFHEGEDK